MAHGGLNLLSESSETPVPFAAGRDRCKWHLDSGRWTLDQLHRGTGIMRHFREFAVKT